MKKITFLFLSFISLGIFFSCNTDDTGGIEDAIHFDTAYLSCELGMETAILLNDTIYVISPRVSNSLGQNDTVQKMYTFNTQGEKLFEVDLDSLFHNYYYLFPLQNQLYASVRINNEDATLQFDPSLQKWVPAEGVKPAPLFEDENYIVTSSSSGEWGGTIFFASKQDGKTPEAYGPAQDGREARLHSAHNGDKPPYTVSCPNPEKPEQGPGSSFHCRCHTPFHYCAPVLIFQARVCSSP